MSAITQEVADNRSSVFREKFQVVRLMNGSAQSLLVRDTADHLWVVKLKSHLQGPHALANEMLGHHLCRSIGLPVPASKKIYLDDHFFEDRRTWFRTAIGDERPKAGFHFASRFFPEERDVEVCEMLPPTVRSTFSDHDECFGMFLFDAWALHADSRQALFFAEGHRTRVAFIDHGHLFGGPNWAHSDFFVGGRMLQRFAIQKYDEQCNLARWANLMRERIPPAFEKAVADLPADWYDGDVQALKYAFLARLNRLEGIAADAVEATRTRIEVMFASEQRIADSPLRILCQRGAERWF